MSDAAGVAVAKAIEYELASHDFGHECIVERSYASPRQTFEGLDTARIDVCHWSTEIDQDASGLLSYLVETDILIRKRFTRKEHDENSAVDVEEVDKMLLFAEKVYEFFVPCDDADPARTGRALTTLTDAHWQPEQTRRLQEYSRERLVDRLFQSWFRLAYGLSKVSGT